MTIQECYRKLGGDYAQVEMRLSSVSLVKRFVAKFLDDGSFSQLCRAMEEGRREDAFRAAHTLKGVCANLCFDKLLASAGQLTELLRPEAGTVPDSTALLLEQVKQDYAQTVGAIRAFLDEESPAV